MSNTTFSITDFSQIKIKVLNWVQQFSTFCFLDNHKYQLPHHSAECLLAAGVKRNIKANAGTALSQLEKFIGENGTWLFGHLAYDLKNETEQLHSLNPDNIGFPDLYFFEPEILIQLSEIEIKIEAGNPSAIFEEIIQQQVDSVNEQNDSVTVNSKFTKAGYISVVEALKKHIVRGDCYEINFCNEFFVKEAFIDPLSIYKKLSVISPNPFSALYRTNDQWLLCASPERFLKKEAGRILSQPIKGTSKRELNNEKQDRQNIKDLFNSSKDRSENVMVVDIVRNDLARVCKEGTVKVDELYGIYSFPQVHQMTSSISGELKEGISFPEIIRSTFPMGSMTGAPKKRVMELIENYEQSKRGIFSGALGYITPKGDFDFNVVIRSILYNASTNYLSFPAGSGITFYSNPENEWEECQLKAEAIKRVLH